MTSTVPAPKLKLVKHKKLVLKQLMGHIDHIGAKLIQGNICFRIRGVMYLWLIDIITAYDLTI